MKPQQFALAALVLQIMPNIYITGDKHRNFFEVAEFCERFGTTKDDLMIVLGDNGVNFAGEIEDCVIKERLQNLPITFMMIRGNHDMRPNNPEYYTLTPVIRPTVSGYFYIQDAYPDLLFATEGYYSIRLKDGYKTAYVIGGAYSVDKQARLINDWGWFPDEQLNKDEMDWVDKHLLGHKVDYMFTHTCPRKYEPTETFLSYLDQSTIDKTMENWLDKVEENIQYEKWYCGHWHIGKSIDKIRFLYHEIILLE